MNDVRFREDHINGRSAKMTKAVLHIRFISKYLDKVEITFVGISQSVGWEAQLNLKEKMKFISLE